MEKPKALLQRLPQRLPLTPRKVPCNFHCLTAPRNNTSHACCQRFTPYSYFIHQRHTSILLFLFWDVRSTSSATGLYAEAPSAQTWFLRILTLTHEDQKPKFVKPL